MTFEPTVVEVMKKITNNSWSSYYLCIAQQIRHNPLRIMNNKKKNTLLVCCQRVKWTRIVNLTSRNSGAVRFIRAAVYTQSLKTHIDQLRRTLHRGQRSTPWFANRSKLKPMVFPDFLADFRAPNKSKMFNYDTSH